MTVLPLQQMMGLALAHYRARRFAEAEALYRQVVARDPDDAEALAMLGVIGYETGRFAEGAEWLRRAIELRPDVAGYYNNLGLLLSGWGRLDESAAALETARRLDPGTADIHFNLGNTYLRQRHWDGAINAFRAALQLQPRHVQAWLNLSATLSACGRHPDALESCRSALEHCPDDATLLTGLGNVLKEMGRLDEALAAYRSALARSPGDPIVLNNLATLHKDCGELAEAQAALRESFAARPKPEIHSNLIFTALLDPADRPETARKEEQRWNALHAVPLRGQRLPHANERSPERRLRVGYVSPDLRNHAVGRTLLPVFEAHDPTQVECVCYAGPATDATAERFRARAEHWRNMETWSDGQLAAQVRADGIDILVDLSLHTGLNRLPAFARKPAPVQVSWLGYPGSSGLETMDYHLTDRFLDPPGEERAESGEHGYRLPDAWCCYPAPENSPDVGPLPALAAGRVTFASFNSFAKINARVLGLWTRILDAVPNSRLLLLARAGRHQERVRTALREAGLAPERVEFPAYLPASPHRDAAAYLQRYAGVDIALDPFPYNGMTTSGDALWMGIPVVALRGVSATGRATFSLLSNLGLPELAAATENEYLQIAIDLAGDPVRLGQWRTTLRARMQASPLLDTARFARNLEAAYRAMWRAWCAQGC